MLELSAIVVGAAAGLRMGWALVDPGLRSRSDALRDAAQGAIRMVVGTVPWFIVAGIIEAFVSRRGLPALPMAIVGIAVGATYWSLVAFQGRPGPQSSQPVEAEPALA